MLNFVKSAFRGFFEVFLWITLIGCMIGGGIIGNSMGGRYGEGHPIIGGIIGLVVGMLINIIAGGFIATILNMDDNLEQLRNDMKSGLSGSKRAAENTNSMGSEWVCKNCGTKNPSTMGACKNCGIYK